MKTLLGSYSQVGGWCVGQVQIGDMSADLRKKRNFVSEVMAAQVRAPPPLPRLHSGRAPSAA